MTKFASSIGLLTVLLVGCAGGKPTGTVAGKVSLKGQPVAGATVKFHLASQGSGGSAKTDAAGLFALPAPIEVGTYAVTVRPTPPDTPPPPGTPIGKLPGAEVPIKYHEDKTSGLTREVKAGKNEFVIELTE